MKTFTGTVVALTALAAKVNAFYGTAHMLVSHYAAMILQVEAPEILAEAETMLAILQASNPDLTTDEGNYPFTECANFADNIKGMGYSFQSDWHFNDQIYLADGGTVDDYDYVKPDYDILGALQSLTDFLTGTADIDSDYYLSTIGDYFSDLGDQQSFALRLIVHYCGDIHQPLHTETEVDDQYPSSDKGGNKEDLQSHSGVYNLHGLWDSVIYDYNGYPRVPLTESDVLWYTAEMATFEQEYPFPQENWHSLDFQTWADEGYQLAIDIVYPGIVEDEIPSAEYQASAKAALRPRLVAGGRRLAELMKYVFGTARHNEHFLQA
jgi:hypothetical protein